MNLERSPFLIRSGLLFIFVSVAGIGSAIFYGMSRLDSLAPHEYVESIARANAGMDAGTVLLRLHDDMLEFVLSDGMSPNDPNQMWSLEERLGTDIAAAEGGDRMKANEIGRLLKEW
ncbi:MAG TPA: hypothetical protein PLK99_09120, partial [Burkholderiales bacterium]|nr:hypothetical protein [Burkholderiales bacterium]